MKVFITREIPEAGLKVLQDAGCELTIHTERRELAPEELINACKQSDAILSSGPNKFDANFFQQCPNIQVVSLMAVGYDNVDVAAANKAKIPVGNTPGVLSNATADTAFLLMLAVSRNAFYLHHKIVDGKWGFFEPTADLGMELYGKTLGIFGLGKIGLELAKRCKAAYGMKVIYHNRSRNQQAEKELGATYVSFDDLSQQSDVLSVHANLSAETKGLFDKSVFSRMKPSSIFINTARGGVHNEGDLIEALQNKTIWGAGLDVTNPEPMKADNPLLKMPHVCVLPHIGSATAEARSGMAILAAENVVAGLQGRRLPNVVNPEVYS